MLSPYVVFLSPAIHGKLERNFLSLLKQIHEAFR